MKLNISIWALMVCGEIHGHKCVSVFQASTAVVPITDVVTNQWTRNLTNFFE